MFNRLQDEINDLFLFRIDDDLLSQEVKDFIEKHYPGNYCLSVEQDLVLHFIFYSPEDATMFILKYS